MSRLFSLFASLSLNASRDKNAVAMDSHDAPSAASIATLMVASDAAIACRTRIKAAVALLRLAAAVYDQHLIRRILSINIAEWMSLA